MNIHGFNDEQLRYYILMRKGVNCFVSGDAGVGKTYLMDKFICDSRADGKNVAVIAPTGMAALNINGSTVHRFLGIGIGPLLVDADRIKPNKMLLSTDILVLDEVSTCRLDLFDYLMASIGQANKVRLSKGLPVIQIIICGDFFQLPPVIIDRDKEVLNQHYGYDINKGFAFQSKYWNMLKLHNIILHQVMRQKDTFFVNVLNKARVGDASCIRDIQMYSSKYVLSNAINILGTNKAVREKNEEELEKIKSKQHVYIGVTTGEVKDSDKMTDDELVLKVGARVMTLVNHNSNLYQNGSLGTIKACNENNVVVEMDTGVVVTIEEHEWDIIGYSIKTVKGQNKLSGDVIGTFTQLPLKLAYAITVHKSQGQTYDAVNLNPYSWDCGQLYVALSRVKDLDKLYLSEQLYNRYLITSKEVIAFYRNMNDQNID